jgi:hypothetical protein
MDTLTADVGSRRGSDTRVSRVIPRMKDDGNVVSITTFQLTVFLA